MSRPYWDGLFYTVFVNEQRIPVPSLRGRIVLPWTTRADDSGRPVPTGTDCSCTRAPVPLCLASRPYGDGLFYPAPGADGKKDSPVPTGTDCSVVDIKQHQHLVSRPYGDGLFLRAHFLCF